MSSFELKVSQFYVTMGFFFLISLNFFVGFWRPSGIILLSTSCQAILICIFNLKFVAAGVSFVLLSVFSHLLEMSLCCDCVLVSKVSKAVFVHMLFMVLFQKWKVGPIFKAATRWDFGMPQVERLRRRLFRRCLISCGHLICNAW